MNFTMRADTPAEAIAHVIGLLKMQRRKYEVDASRSIPKRMELAALSRVAAIDDVLGLLRDVTVAPKDAPPKPSDDCSLSTFELAECAKINLENLVKLVPALQSHPFFMIAKDQLDVVAKRLAHKEGIRS